MISSFVRTIILYFVVIVSFRLMGKRQIGELQPSELVIAIMISDLATIPMQETGVPLLYGIIPIIVLLFLELMISLIAMKSRKFRNILCGKPSVLIYNSIINRAELEKVRFSCDDLLEELRLNGNPNIDDILYAIMETNGQISVILKPEKRGNGNAN